ncbi:hypothetical protein EVAR_72997_1 [Eumeta japonica]|uniref:Uncharacterized protein n=1 Tax=Eumeta variegata TaxID=151549 RepID=A0A4C1TMI0_EUMVA|nr:hypothetical protein EVAR_72997_1 [Eumeta japonica]
MAPETDAYLLVFESTDELSSISKMSAAYRRAERLTKTTKGSFDPKNRTYRFVTVMQIFYSLSHLVAHGVYLLACYAAVQRLQIVYADHTVCCSPTENKTSA